jgi:hypothetical protein
MSRRDRRNDGFDGVRVTAHPRRARLVPWLALAAVILALAAGWWWLGGSEADAGTDVAERRADAASPADPAAVAPVQLAGSGPSAPKGAQHGDRGAAPTGPDGEDPTPDLSDYVLPGEAPEMAQVIEALHARGIRTGLGAFQPPGTSPPLEGLEVPEGFPLPDGYVRHHQATDDGQRIAPILMFGPDIDSIVVRGVRVPVSPNRVVPPDLAPPGMPLRRVRIPPPRDSGGGS